MKAILILATIVASVVAPPPKQKVHFQPVPKAVPHEKPTVVGKRIPLLQQHPRVHTEVITVVDQEAVIVKRPKTIIHERPVTVYYPVDKPIIQHKRIIKPIHKERTIVIKKPIEVPRPIVKHKTVGVPRPFIVQKPFKRVRTVTNVIERVQKIPKAIPRPELRIVHRDRPFPVENLVIKKKPRVIEVPYDKPFPIVEEITNVVRKPVAQPKNKVVTVDHPVVNHRKVPYYPKGAGGYHGGYGQFGYQQGLVGGFGKQGMFPYGYGK